MSKTQQIPAFCAQCRSRCGCLAEVQDGRLTGIKPLPEHPSGEKLCPKGLASSELVYHPDRLLQPMRRSNPKGSDDPGWITISWDEALDTIAAQMQQIAQDNGPEATAFSVTTPSGTSVSDSIVWIERLIRAYGSPNTIYGTEICNWHKDFASRFTFGYDIGVPDFEHSDCMILWGNNPSSTWLARAVEVNKARRRGAKLLVVDPRPTSFAHRADVWLAITPGTDQALALGLAHLLIKTAQFDHDFVRQWTNGVFLVRNDNGRFLRESDIRPDGDSQVLLALAEDDTELLRYHSGERRWLDNGTPRLQTTGEVDTLSGPVRCTSAFEKYITLLEAFTPERVAVLSGASVESLNAAAELLAQSKSVAYYAWNGIGQSITASQTDRALSLLYTLTGSYGRQGGNVPGAAAVFNDISGLDLIKPEQAARALGLKERPLGPPAQGWITARDFYRAVLDGTPYPVRMLMSFGTNLLTSQPDTELGHKALQALDFHVHADFFINSTAKYADIVLPVSTSWEREGLRTGFDASLRGQRRVQMRPAVVTPLGESRSDIDIVLGLAQRLGLADIFFGLDVDRGHNVMLADTGLSVETLRATPEGIDLPSAVKLEPFAELNEKGIALGFPTASGRIEIYSEILTEHGQAPLPILSENELSISNHRFPLRLSCAKTLFYCHGQHRNLPSLRRLQPDPPLEISAEDAAARNIKNGDWVRIVTACGEALAKAHIVKKLKAGSVFAQHGWWVPGSADAPYDSDDALAANINQLIDSDARDPISGSLPLRASACEVVRLESSD